ncbi:MAG: 50S ribosomal protein L24 [Oscillospiraceae bacterium]|nr:50S ribosomal protein L24 [Oscillospiraceae bacterium]
MGLYKSVDKSGSVAHIKKDDEVIVISGDDKGRRGKVIEVAPKEGKLIIDGVNTVSKHVKPRRQGQPGGIIKTSGPIYACKVLPYCTKCGKGVRVKEKASGENKSVRTCASCGEEL